jgi:hypothetical protein
MTGTDTLVSSSIALSQHSNFDVVYIFILLFFTSLTSFIVVWLARVVERRLTELSNSVDNGQVLCAKRNSDNVKKDDANIRYLEAHIRNISNLIHELIKNRDFLFCSTEFALELFDIIMKSHCLNKAHLLAKSIYENNGKNQEEVIKTLSIEFKAITDYEYDLMKQIPYANNHTLAETLEKIRTKQEWAKFTETYIGALVKEYWFERNTLKIEEATVTLLTNLVEGMKEQIRENGRSNV